MMPRILNIILYNVDEPCAYGNHCGFVAGVYLQLAEDVALVGGDGMNGREAFGGDFLHGLSLCSKSEYLAFRLRKFCQRVVFRSVWVKEKVHQSLANETLVRYGKYQSA